MTRIRYLARTPLNELTATRIVDAARRRWADTPHRFAWEYSRAGREEKLLLARFRDCHQGERCFIVANGPSLKQLDLSLLAGETTFGMNRIYRLGGSAGFSPSYLACVDIDSQLEQIHHELDQLSIPKFLNWNARHLFPVRDPHTHFLKLTFRPRFSKDPTLGLWGGHSVTNVCLQLAFYFGFEEVILIGKDHSYQEQGVPGEVRTSTGEEDNHFVKGYYAPGATWRIPDYRGEELAYTMAREAFEAAGRKVWDATPGGKLQIFPKVRFEEVL